MPPISSNLKINTTTTTNDNPLSFTFTANEPVVGFSVDDIAVTGGSLSSFTATSSTVYNASFVPSSDGKTTIDIPADRVNDVAGNGNNTATQFEWSYDGTAPKVSITALNFTGNAITSGDTTSDDSLKLIFSSTAKHFLILH